MKIRFGNEEILFIAFKCSQLNTIQVDCRSTQYCLVQVMVRISEYTPVKSKLSLVDM